MATPRPTEAELDILRVLWELGPSTVRQIHDVLNAERDIGYTTVLKLMQIMADKGLVVRDATVRPQVYKAARSEKQTQKQLTGEFLERLFDGSPGKLVMQALSSRRTSAEDLAQTRELLDRLEAEQGDEA